MKKTLKGATVTFFIISLLLTVAWLVVFSLHGLLAADINFNFKLFLDNWVMPRVNLFPQFFTGVEYGFAPAADKVVKLFGVNIYSYILTFVGFGLVGVMVIFMIVGLILSIKRKRARYIWFGLLMLLSLLAVLEFVVYLAPYYAQHLKFIYDDYYETGNVIFTLTTLFLALLAYIFTIVEVFIGLARAKRLLREKKQSQEEALVEETPTLEEAPVEETPAQDVNELFKVASVTDNDIVVAPVEEEKNEDYDTMVDFVAEPEEQVVETEKPVEQAPEQKDAITKDDLASILKDVVRGIVREEIALAKHHKEEGSCDSSSRDGDHSITGATFGGPLVVQYFNGGINGQDTAPTYAPAPKKEEAKPEPKPEPAPAPVVVPPVVVVEQPAPVEEPKEKNPIIRIPFTERMLSAEKEMKDNYNELKNEVMSYGVNSRVSNSGDTFRLHRKTYLKITIAGKSLKLYFALDPKDYADSKMPIDDASKHEVYAEIPLVFKVKSGLSLRRAKELIRDVMSKDGLEQGEVGSVNWVKELKANAK